MKPEAHEQIAERKLFVEKLIQSCTLCPQRCGVNRKAGQKGFCGLDDCAYCFRELLHPHEEQELSPSHQVYFTGCNLRCEYCTVCEWNESPQEDEAIPLESLLDRIRQRREQGALTLNFLGGEPSVNLYGILEVLERVDPSYRVIWNSNMYYCDPVDEVLQGLADVFLADVKFGDPVCAEKIAGVADYVPVVRENVAKAAKHADVIVRHLVLPGHLECCLHPLLEWLAANLPEVKFSLRMDYVPPADTVWSPDRYLSVAEQQKAIEMTERYHLNRIT